MSQDGMPDRNTHHVLARLIKHVVADGSMYVNFNIICHNRINFTKKKNTFFLCKSLPMIRQRVGLLRRPRLFVIVSTDCKTIHLHWLLPSAYACTNHSVSSEKNWQRLFKKPASTGDAISTFTCWSIAHHLYHPQDSSSPYSTHIYNSRNKTYCIK